MKIKVQNDNVKFKIISLFFSALLLSGCVKNVDLREQAKGNKAKEQKNFSSKRSAVDLKEENSQSSENVTAGKELVKILFVGDMMFDRHIREAVGKYGDGNYNYIFEPVKDELTGHDLVVGNLEGPITDAKSVSANTKMGESKNFVFTFDPAVAKTLAENNIRLVNLGNNHILNQGKEGLEETKKYLGEAGVEYFGFDEGSTFVKDDIAFVGYNYSAVESAERALADIREFKAQSDIVVVCPHWGTEYKTGDPGTNVRRLAHRFIEAGADAVIGTHPHVIQNSEEYQGKKIYYSLGNFVFDQYFQKETMEGLGVEVLIKPGCEIEYNEIRFIMNRRGQTELKYPLSNF